MWPECAQASSFHSTWLSACHCTGAVALSFVFAGIPLTTWVFGLCHIVIVCHVSTY